MAGVERRQEAGGVVDVAMRIEHVGNAAELRGVIVMVDLHAAEIDQRLAVAAGGCEVGKGFGPAARKDGFSFYVQGVGLQAALVAGFRQADGVEDTGGDAVAIGRAQDLRFARIGGGENTTRREAK